MMCTCRSATMGTLVGMEIRESSLRWCHPHRLLSQTSCRHRTGRTSPALETKATTEGRMRMTQRGVATCSGKTSAHGRWRGYRGRCTCSLTTGSLLPGSWSKLFSSSLTLPTSAPPWPWPLKTKGRKRCWGALWQPWWLSGLSGFGSSSSIGACVLPTTPQGGLRVPGDCAEGHDGEWCKQGQAVARRLRATLVWGQRFPQLAGFLWLLWDRFCSRSALGFRFKLACFLPGKKLQTPRFITASKLTVSSFTP